MEMIKKNITLALGIAIPILMILFVAGSIYLPGIFIKPRVNFLYVSGDGYYYNQQQYSVQNEKLVKNEITQIENYSNNQPKIAAKLFIYDVAMNTGKEVSFDEAQKLNLDSNNISPDDFEIAQGGAGGGVFPFFFYSGSDYNTRYLTGHNISKKLNIQTGGSYYDNFRFLGWIK
jgi:hypothetical protein